MGAVHHRVSTVGYSALLLEAQELHARSVPSLSHEHFAEIMLDTTDIGIRRFSCKHKPPRDMPNL